MEVWDVKDNILVAWVAVSVPIPSPPTVLYPMGPSQTF